MRRSLLGAELQASLRRLPVLLLASLLANLSVIAGVLLLVLPGVFLLVCYLVLLPVMLFDGRPLPALRAQRAADAAAVVEGAGRAGHRGAVSLIGALWSAASAGVVADAARGQRCRHAGRGRDAGAVAF